MNQTERMTASATMMMHAFATRMAQYAQMSDEQLSQTLKVLTAEHGMNSQANIHAQAAYGYASKQASKITTLSASEQKARASVASTPWYQPFKRAALRSEISKIGADLTVARKEFAESNCALILKRKVGAAFESPAMKASGMAIREISATIQNRQAERAQQMREQFKMQKQRHAERLAEKQNQGPSMAMEIFYAMADDLDERFENEREQQLEREIPRYGYSYSPRG